jgi:hypothetical protein
MRAVSSYKGWFHERAVLTLVKRRPVATALGRSAWSTASIASQARGENQRAACARLQHNISTLRHGRNGWHVADGRGPAATSWFARVAQLVAGEVIATILLIPGSACVSNNRNEIEQEASSS